MPTHRPFSAQLSCCAVPSLRGAPACERTGSHVRRLGGVGGWAWARERWSTGFSRPRRTCLCPRDSAVRWEVARARGWRWGGEGGGLDAASTRSEDRDTNELVSVGRSGASASHHGV